MQLEDNQIFFSVPLFFVWGENQTPLQSERGRRLILLNREREKNKLMICSRRIDRS